jgi:nicotinamide-nucleotide amidase
MRAEIIAVGSELLAPGRIETNGAYIAARLCDVGVGVVARTTVGDELIALEASFRVALERAEVVLATGGLGPTADDITREAAAAALGRRLVRDPALLSALRSRFARLGRPMAAVNEKQADLIEGAVALPNPRGTAPGQRVAVGGRLVVLLPGPPREMEPMLEEQVLPLLRERVGERVLRRRVLKVAGLPEGDVDEAVAPVYTAVSNPRTTILGGPGQVELHLTATGANDAEAEAALDELSARLCARLPGRVVSDDGRGLAEIVVALLREGRETLAVAESCTGGLLASRVCGVPGASTILDRGLVSYSNRSKVELLGLEPALIESHGAVSEEVARAMAEGACERARTSVGIGITGIAGPDGGTAEKPVGLVFLAVCRHGATRARRALLPGDRERIRFQATQIALDMLRRWLLGLEDA